MISIWIAVIGWFVAGAIGYAIACLMVASSNADDCAECQRSQRLEQHKNINKVLNFLSDDLKKGYVKRAS